MESNGPPKDNPTTVPLKTPVEDLPLSDRVKLAEAYKLSQEIAVGDFIDAKDTVDNWCVATVLKVDAGEVHLNYDGWSSKYDFVYFLFPLILPIVV